MPEQATDWFADISFDGVPGVPGVPPQFSAISSGTPSPVAGVPGVPNLGREHLRTPPEHHALDSKSLKKHKEHQGTPRTPKNNDAVWRSALPVEIVVGLDRLRAEPQPRLSSPSAWAGVVTDAHMIASEGWAAVAVSLGWSPLNLFGSSPEIGGNADLDGLAVWLSGRKIVAIDERVVVADAAGARALYYGRPMKGAALLWDLRDIQSKRMRGKAHD